MFAARIDLAVAVVARKVYFVPLLPAAQVAYDCTVRAVVSAMYVGSVGIFACVEFPVAATIAVVHRKNFF